MIIYVGFIVCEDFEADTTSRIYYCKRVQYVGA